MAWCIVDRMGKVVEVSSDWNLFALANNGDPKLMGVGSNYLDVCKGSPVAEMTRQLIRSVLDRRREDFSLTYNCHGPQAARFFRLIGTQNALGCRLEHRLIVEVSNGE